MSINVLLRNVSFSCSSNVLHLFSLILSTNVEIPLGNPKPLTLWFLFNANWPTNLRTVKHRETASLAVPLMVFRFGTKYDQCGSKLHCTTPSVKVMFQPVPVPCMCTYMHGLNSTRDVFCLFIDLSFVNMRSWWETWKPVNSNWTEPPCLVWLCGLVAWLWFRKIRIAIFEQEFYFRIQ